MAFLGRSTPLPGYNLYVEMNVFRLDIGLSVFELPPALPPFSPNGMAGTTRQAGPRHRPRSVTVGLAHASLNGAKAVLVPDNQRIHQLYSHLRWKHPRYGPVAIRHHTLTPL